MADLNAPLTKFQAITKSDSTEYEPTRAIMVGVAGNLAIIGSDDTSAVTLVAVAAGVWHPISATKIMSTNTTATDIKAGW